MGVFCLPARFWSVRPGPPGQRSAIAWGRRAWRRWLHPVGRRLRRDPLARLTSLAEVPVAAEVGLQIDVNQATIDDWLRLPGISIHQARTLVQLSQRGVTFHCLADVAAALDLPSHRLQPLEPLLRFCYYDPSSLVTPAQVSLNQAPLTQLLRVPGVSAELAERIVNERRRSPFRGWAEVHQRLRLTPEQTAQWMHWLRL